MRISKVSAPAGLAKGGTIGADAARGTTAADAINVVHAPEADHGQAAIGGVDRDPVEPPAREDLAPAAAAPAQTVDLGVMTADHAEMIVGPVAKSSRRLRLLG